MQSQLLKFNKIFETMSKKYYKIRNKFIIPMVLFFTLGIIIFVITVHRMNLNKFENEVSQNGQRARKDLDQVFQMFADEAFYIAANFSSQPAVLTSYEISDLEVAKDSLRSKLSNTIIRFKQASKLKDKLKIHFHKPPATSLWRSWREAGKADGGDDLSTFRTTVLLVNKTFEPIKGLEAGRGGMVLRGIVPIFNKNTHVGSVESFFDLEDVLPGLHLRQDENISIFVINKNIADVKFFEERKINGDFTFLNQYKQEGVEHIAQEFLLNGIDTFYSTIKDSIGYSTFPIKDALGKIVAVACYTNNISEEKYESLKERNTNMGVMLAAVLLLIIFFTILSNRVFTQPINSLNDTLAKVAAGDLSVKVEVKNRDELGKLADVLNDTFEKVKNMLASVKLAASNLGDASEHINASAQDVSQGASEQAASVEQVSASMEQMTANIEQNMHNSQETEKIVLKAAAAVHQGSKSVKQTAVLMQNIKEKVSIINDIAKQTNILALNASVEAASAGEFGRGFSVIAKEIRQLAEYSRMSAVEIEDSVNKGAGISERADKQLTDIVEQMEKSSELIKQIATASAEQNNGVEQITNGVQMLNRVTQQNAAVSEEMATNSEELAAQAELLRNSTNFFILDESDRKTKIHKEQYKEQHKEKNKSISSLQEQNDDDGYEDFNSLPEMTNNKTNKLAEIRPNNTNTRKDKRNDDGFTIELGDISDDDFERF